MEGNTLRAERSFPRRLLGTFFSDTYSYSVPWMVAIAFLVRWEDFVYSHEAIYLLGSRKVADPEFLSLDLTWGTLPPVTFLHDYLVASLRSFMGDFGIVTFGRWAMWILFAWALSRVARLVRVPPWSAVAGFTLWMLAEQTLMACGAPIEGFQPKSFAYPCVFFALGFAMQGKVIRAGALAGLGTAFHLIVGGWGCLAVFVAMVVNRKDYTFRQLAYYIAASAPCILPTLAATWLFVGGMSSDESASMSEIYVTFAWPICLDPAKFLSLNQFVMSIGVFGTTPVLLWLWPQRREARFVAIFTLSLIAVFALGLVGWWLEAYWFLKLFPFQLANALPVLLLMILCFAYIGSRPPAARLGRIAWIAGIIVALWFADDEDAFREVRKIPERMWSEVQVISESTARSRYGDRLEAVDFHMYDWIRENTPRDSIFITPYVSEFWTYAERAQVAGFRHPPYDRNFLDWYDRLVALNNDREFKTTGHQIKKELKKNQGKLPVGELIRMREEYGATHYMSSEDREDLLPYRLYRGAGWYIYDVTRLD